MICLDCLPKTGYVCPPHRTSPDPSDAAVTEPLPRTEPLTAEERAYNLGWGEGMANAMDACNPIIEGLQARLAALLPSTPVRPDLTRRMLEFVAAQPVGFGDWACVECKPGSDILVEGFRCMVHEARAALRAEQVEPETWAQRNGWPEGSHRDEWNDHVAANEARAEQVEPDRTDAAEGGHEQVGAPWSISANASTASATGTPAAGTARLSAEPVGPDDTVETSGRAEQVERPDHRPNDTNDPVDAEWEALVTDLHLDDSVASDQTCSRGLRDDPPSRRARTGLDTTTHECGRHRRI